MLLVSPHGVLPSSGNGGASVGMGTRLGLAMCSGMLWALVLRQVLKTQGVTVLEGAELLAGGFQVQAG